MAKKRMYSNAVTDSDAFIEMSSAAQALYFHLNQGADDDGFNNQIQIAMLKAHASTDDLKILMAKNFVIRFESGVIVIKHWRLHNTLRKDRYTPTNYQEELSLLGIKDNGAYTLGCQSVAERLPDGCPSIDKNRLVEISIVEEREEDASPPTAPSRNFIPPTIEEVESYCRQRGNQVNAEAFIAFYASKGWMVGKNKMKDWKSAVITWEKRDKEKPSRSGGNVFLEIAQEEGLI